MDNKRAYAIIPIQILQDENIPASAKMLYGVITTVCDDSGYCWFSQKEVAGLLKKQPSSTRKWFKQLENHGYIDIIIEYEKGTDYELSKKIKLLKWDCRPHVKRINEIIANLKVNDIIADLSKEE